MSRRRPPIASAALLLAAALPAWSAADLRVLIRFDEAGIRLERLADAPDAPRRIGIEPGGWTAVTRDAAGTAIDERSFRDPRLLHAEWLDDASGELRGRPVLLDEGLFELVLPVEPDRAASMELYDEGDRLIAVLDLGDPAGVDASCTGGWATTLVRDTGDPANRLNITFLGDGYTASELGSYASDVDDTIDYLLAREPYSEYRDFINIWRVDVISNESGADEPDNGIEKDTALDCSFDWGGTPRCLYCPSDPVNDAAACVPETDEILVVVNTTRYGGCGGAFSVYAGKNSSATDIAFHEMGHSFAGLADEYSGGGTWPPFFEHPDKNCSRDSSAVMASEQDKWWYWLGDQGVSTFEGCGGSYSFGVHRPVVDCEMRSLNRVLCPICREEHILDYHARVDPIDGALPATDPTILQEQSASFSVTRVQPWTHDQDVAWFVDDVLQPGQTADDFQIDGTSLALGAHPVRVEVSDGTPDVRDDPLGLLQSQRGWTLTVECVGAAADYDTDGDGICEPGLGGSDCDDDDGSVWALPGEVTGLLFSADKQTLSWTAPAQTGGSAGSLVYDTLRSDDPASFAAAVCLESDEGGDTSAVDPASPAAGALWSYLVRADNACPGEGSLGTDSDSVERSGTACP